MVLSGSSRARAPSPAATSTPRGSKPKRRSNPGTQARNPTRFGVFTSSGNTSTFIDAFAAGAKYDIATGLGSVNVTNLINKWNTAFTSSTKLTANPTSITAAQSTALTATVTGGTPPGSTGKAPTLTGSVNFKAGSTAIGSCTLSGGTCSTLVPGTALALGANSITATFVGSKSYPSSTSSIVTVTVTSTGKVPNFNIVPYPPKETVYRGRFGGFLLQLNSTNGFNGNVSLSCSGGPTGSYCTNFPMSVKVNGTAYALSAMWFPRNSAPGVYTIKFTGVSGSLTNTATALFTLK